jgi:hypothetical protein
MRKLGTKIVVATCLPLLVAVSASAVTLYTAPISGERFDCGIANVSTQALKIRIMALNSSGTVVAADPAPVAYPAGAVHYLNSPDTSAVYCRFNVTASGFTPTKSMVRAMSVLNFGTANSLVVPAQ